MRALPGGAALILFLATNYTNFHLFFSFSRRFVKPVLSLSKDSWRTSFDQSLVFKGVGTEVEQNRQFMIEIRRPVAPHLIVE